MHKLTDKLWKEIKYLTFYKPTSIGSEFQLDTLITDFMKQHDKEFQREILRKFFGDEQQFDKKYWGIEKRREQASKAKLEIIKEGYGLSEKLPKIIDTAFGLEPVNKQSEGEERPPNTEPQPEKQYPCSDYGKLRTKDEGGTTFTVCDECWDKHYKKNPEPQSQEKCPKHDVNCTYCGFSYLKEIAELKKRVEAIEKGMIEIYFGGIGK